MLCLHVCLHSLYMRVPEPLEQELYVVVSHHVVLGNEPGYSGRVANHLNL